MHADEAKWRQAEQLRLDELGDAANDAEARRELFGPLQVRAAFVAFERGEGACV